MYLLWGASPQGLPRSTCYDISSDQATIAVRSRSVHLEGAPRAAADEAFSGSRRSFRRSTQDSTALHETTKFRAVQLISDVIRFDRAATMWRRIEHWWSRLRPSGGTI